mgnify:CR=1 FL=1
MRPCGRCPASVFQPPTHAGDRNCALQHIENVLARLNSPPLPELAETDLELIEAPRADTARYDELRDIHTQEPETHHAP